MSASRGYENYETILYLVAQYIGYIYSYITEALHFYFDSNILKLLAFSLLSFLRKSNFMLDYN